MPLAKRQGLRAGLLTCEGDVNETAGDNARAKALYEQAVAVGSGARMTTRCSRVPCSPAATCWASWATTPQGCRTCAALSPCSRRRDAAARRHRAERHRHSLQPHGGQSAGRPHLHARPEGAAGVGPAARSRRHALQPGARPREPEGMGVRAPVVCRVPRHQQGNRLPAG